MASFKPDQPSASDSPETQKLRLEIIELRKKTRWQLAPIITALISISGLILSVLLFGWQQSAEQEKNRAARELERRTALQNRISSETDEILRFPGDPKLTISRVAFLLADVQSMLDSPINRIMTDPPLKPDAKFADALPEYNQHLTRSLVILVKDECDLSGNARDAGVVRVISQNWPTYQDYLVGNPMEDLNYVLWKYTQAVEKFHQENPGYLESFRPTEEAIEPGSKYKSQENEYLRWGHVLDLSDGFKEHLKILCRPPQTEETNTMRHGRFNDFKTGLANPIVSNFLLKAKDDKEFCEVVLKKEK